jgi:hypothetical protein
MGNGGGGGEEIEQFLIAATFLTDNK